MPTIPNGPAEEANPGPSRDTGPHPAVPLIASVLGRPTVYSTYTEMATVIVTELVESGLLADVDHTRRAAPARVDALREDVTTLARIMLAGEPGSVSPAAIRKLNDIIDRGPLLAAVAGQ